MGIADLFRPKYRHSDVRVRTEAVRALTTDDAAILVQVARTDRDIGVRRIAIEKIDAADVLAELASAETERSLRDFAGERAAQLWTQAACADDGDAANTALAGIVKLGDQHALVDVALRAANAAVRKKAFLELRDPKALADLAKREGPQDIRLAAVGRIDDGDALRALAIDTTTKEVGLAAVDKLDDVDRLENIAQKAKNKAVRQRARKIVQEIAEAERAKQKSSVPDDVKRRRAEKAQLVRELEAIADSFDFDKVAPKVKTAEDQWAALGGTDDIDDRFRKAVERFWKRKQIHDETARKPEELRAIQREAEAQKEKAAVEEPPAPVVEDEEAKARREERERRKAEAEARRAAEAAEREARAAEREARKKEDAERGAAIAASLTALVEDMEKLAETRDGRAIDRLLQQAGKAFEQVGKVPAEQRDALSDRYTKARGKLVIKASELREAEDWQRFQNVPKAEALIATAKELLAAENVPDLGNRLRALQALWKEVGPMPQRRSKELWDQFKQVCDAIYERVKGIRAVDAEKFAEVAKAKEALIAEAEALAESTDWAATADRLKQLQAQWKESGHLPRKQGDELWKRFRAACDRFFERRKPQLEARHAEEEQNLARKQALIERARQVAAKAPDDGGWGKAIGQIKDLQQQWKTIGFVPRRDADAVYKAFRAACDSLFAKRDEARDAEANQHRDAIDDVKGEIADLLVEAGDDVVAKTVAIRAKARELDSRELAQSVEQLVRHVVTAHADKVAGTELDPSAARARREKLLGKVEELLPKQAPAVTADAAPADIAAQLKQAMRSNAFGDLRFSGRDPVEVVDELRTQWIEAGPVLDDADRAQQARFDDLTKQVLDAAGAAAKADRDRGGDEDRGERGERGRRRRRDERGVDDSGRRRDRRSAEPPQTAPAASASPAPSTAPSFAAAPAPAPRPEPRDVAAAAAGVVGNVPAAIPQTAHDAITAPAQLPFSPAPAPSVPPSPAASALPSMPAIPPVSASTAPVVEPPRAKPATNAPPIEEIDEGWDLGDDDPTASASAEQAAADADDEMQRPQPDVPSSSEMAGDSATGGDGIDEPGWD